MGPRRPCPGFPKGTERGRYLPFGGLSLSAHVLGGVTLREAPVPLTGASGLSSCPALPLSGDLFLVEVVLWIALL